MRNKIREIRERKGLSQADLAELLGVHWQSVHRAEAGKSTLTPVKQQRYASALGVSVADVFSGTESRMVRVAGHVQAGHWAETWELPYEDQYDVPIPPDPSLAKAKLYGAEVRGPSMNRRYPEGTVIIFTHAIETGEEFQVGKRYVIERIRADGMREATVKTLWRDDGGTLWLLPESDDPRFQSPIPIEALEHEEVRIIGRVRYAVSRE